MMDGNRLRAYFTEQEWNETPNERKLRLAAERAAIGERVVSKEQTWAEVGDAAVVLPPTKSQTYSIAPSEWHEAKKSVGSGICPKCHKAVGRGVYGHWRKCDGE